VCACGQDKGGDTDTEWQDDVPEALAGPVGVPSVQEGREDCQDVRWCGKQQSMDVIVAERFHNSLRAISQRLTITVFMINLLGRSW